MILAYETAFQKRHAFLTIFVLILIILSISLSYKIGNYTDCAALCIYSLVFLAEWIYLGYGGRVPDRVVWSLLVCDGLLRLAYILKALTYFPISFCSLFKGRKRVFYIAFFCICFFVFILEVLVKSDLEATDAATQQKNWKHPLYWSIICRCTLKTFMF